jgi:hypothetical protein
MEQGTFTLFLFFLVSFAMISASPIPKHDRLERRYNGMATWFYPKVGACGDTNSKADYIVAMNHAQVRNPFFFSEGNMIVSLQILIPSF